MSVSKNIKITSHFGIVLVLAVMSLSWSVLLIFRLFLFQWQSLNTPLSFMKVAGEIMSSVHHQYLYISATLQDNSCVVYRTNDLVRWEKIPTPQDVRSCHSLKLASRAQSNCLYGLWTTTAPADQHHLILHRLNDKVWERMPNARTPQKQWQPAGFCLGNSLMLAGGHGGGRNSINVVQEYSFTDQKWLSDSQWPVLQKDADAVSPVVTKNAVHLIGGAILCEGHWSENHSVLTVPAQRQKPAGEWLTDVFPDTPALVGAQNVLECPVVCGGMEQGQYLSRVSLFDVEERQWLSLPQLLQPRSYIAVEYFQNSLTTFGGHTGRVWSSSAEFLANFVASTWLE